MPDLYKILGVSRTATQKRIKVAFRELAKGSHPDLNPGDKIAEQRFKEFNRAYEILSDPDARAAYDLDLGRERARARRHYLQAAATMTATLLLTVSSISFAFLWGQSTTTSRLQIPEPNSSSYNEIAAATQGRLRSNGEGTPQANVPTGAPSPEQLPESNTQVGQHLSEFEERANPVPLAQSGADNVSIVTSAADATARVWGADTMQQLRELRSPGDEVQRAPLTAGEARIATGSSARTARVWDVNSMQQLRDLDDHGDAVHGTQLRSEGARIVRGSDPTVRVWDTNSEEQLLELRSQAR